MALVAHLPWIEAPVYDVELRSSCDESYLNEMIKTSWSKGSCVKEKQAKLRGVPTLLNETLYRVPLNVCLGILKFTNHVATVVEAKEMPFRFHANTRGLRYIEHQHRTLSTSLPLQRFVDHPCYHVRSLTATFNNVSGTPSSQPPITPPQSNRSSLLMHTESVGIKKKSAAPDSVM